MAKTRIHVFQDWEKSVGLRRYSLAHRQRIHLLSSRLSSTFIGLARHEAGWLTMGSLYVEIEGLSSHDLI